MMSSKKTKELRPHLGRYIYEGSSKIGVVVVCESDSGEIKLGWSMCSSKDQFSRSRGRDIAIKRALSGTTNWKALIEMTYKEIYFTKIPLEYREQVFTKSQKLVRMWNKRN